MRKRRVLREGAYYHVIARVNNKENLLEYDSIKILFEKTVIRAKRKYSFNIENFVLMGNHFHMIIQPLNGENLSKIMQWIMSVFAMTFNRTFKRWGHFWGERFFSCVLDTLRQFIKTFEYIDQNPVRAGLVKNLTQWEFGGMRHHRSGNRSILTEIPNFLSFIINTHAQLALPWLRDRSIEQN